MTELAVYIRKQRESVSEVCPCNFISADGIERI
ncbi:MAG: DUF3763 domain-containing protein [Ignavibacteriaceae bacterium]|nr:DUF3763 domain-containing protein [Ignavibacteriaceae bacterium]